MMFFGDLFSCNEMSIPCTPTDINNITRVEISDGWYDDLRITKNVTEKLSATVNQDWDWDTILHAKFNDSLGAGNVLWNLDLVSHLLIKRKKVDDFKWITLDVQKIVSVEDFNIRGTDITATPNNEYEYAAVPIFNGVEGFYSKTKVDVDIDSVVIADRDEIWCTIFSDNYFDSTTPSTSSVVTTMYDKYPTVVRNSDANYEEVSVTASFFPLDETGGCDFDVSDKARIKYLNKAKEFLKNGEIKILKSMDGRVWLVDINTPPTDSANGHHANRQLTFSCVEIGDVNNEEYLWEYGFISEDVTEDYWLK